MDINCHKFSNSTWELEMSMEDQILQDHHHKIPLTSIYPTQDHQQLLPSSSSFICEPRGKFNNHHQVEEAVQEADEEEEELGAMKEMMFKIAAMQPVDIDPATIHKPKRRNVRISDDPQSVAARHRRERISEKIRILQRLVPGGTKMDTASMLEEAGRYIKFLKRQIKQLQANHQSQCIGMMSNCLSSQELQRMTSNKPVVEHIGSASTASFSIEIPLVHFNHEVISDNQYN